MKTGILANKRLRHAGAILVFFFAHLVFAAEPLRDVSREMSGLHSTAIEADLYLLGRDLSFRSDLDETDVIRMGCHYKAGSGKDIASLIDVAADAAVLQVPPNREGADARIVLRIRLKDRRYVSLVTSADYDNAPTNGAYFDGQTGHQNGISIEATKGFEKSLRFWAAHHAALAVKPCHR